MNSILIVLLALIFNLPVGYFAIKKDSLVLPDGLTVAGLLGLILFLAHPVYWVLLLVFFTSSTLLTSFKVNSKIKQEAIDYAEKGGTRDGSQVLANGGIPLLIAFSSLILGLWNVVLNEWYSILFATSLAVVNADTWATELGVTSTKEPFWILNPTKRVPRGTSGGISSLGLIASLIGSISISVILLISAMIVNTPLSPYQFFLVILGGMIGSLTDSVLGATIQGQYLCTVCNKITEKQSHCGKPSTHIRGIKWFNNDLVNFTSVLVSIATIYLLLF